MLIVGGGAALTAVAAWLAWLAVKSLGASWRARAATKRDEAREGAYRYAHEHENAHSSS